MTTEKKTHILVCTPMYGGMCTGYYTQSLLTLGNACVANGMQMSASFMFNESLIQRARNALAHQFLANESFTHLMFIDADIKFNPADIPPMVLADVDVICGIYPKKEINWAGVEEAAKNGVPVKEWKTRTGSLVVNLKDYSGSITVPADKPCEIWNGGTGFMLIKRQTFDNLIPHIKKYKNDVQFLGKGIADEWVYEFFNCPIEEGTNRLLSEDFAFCKSVRDAGMKVWVAPWARLGHFGTYLFEGSFIDAP